MPENNVRLDDYGDGSEPKNPRWKFFAVFVGIILVAVAFFTILRLISK